MAIYKFFIIAALLFCSVSAVGADDNDVNREISRELQHLKKHPDDMESLRVLCVAYLNKADFNKAIWWGQRLQNIAYNKKDYKRYVIYSHIIMGEAYTMKGNKSTAYSNLMQAQLNAKSADNDTITCSVCNAMAIYYVNMMNDTYSALTYLFRGLEKARKCESDKMYNILLSNIAEVYYLRGDTTGLKYALECHERGRKVHNYVLMFHSAISAAYLYYMKGQLDIASQYLDECSSLMDKRKFHDRAQVFNIRGMIALRRNKAADALEWFRRSIAEKPDASVPNMACAYLGYGRAASALGRQDEAVDSLHRGLTMVETTNSNRYLPEILLAISNCEELRGDKGEALRYYKKFHECADTLFRTEREQAVSDIMAKYDIAMKESQFKQQQLDLLKSHSRMMLLAILLIVMVVVATLLYILYRRKNILYKAIVQQNIDAIRREQTLKEELRGNRGQGKYASSSLTDDHKKTLFARLETLMDEQKPYHDHLLTKEKVAEMLETNRTYLSQAINEQTGQTFTAYIGSLRIKEAVRIISDPKNTMPLKAVSSEVGFSSMTTFYNQFQATMGMTPATYRQKVIEMN